MSNGEYRQGGAATLPARLRTRAHSNSTPQTHRLGMTPNLTGTLRPQWVQAHLPYHRRVFRSGPPRSSAQTAPTNRESASPSSESTSRIGLAPS